MINATPLASEQITQEDEALAALCVPNALIFADDYSHILDARRRASQHIARHRIAALSSTPAPSDQDASQGEVIARVIEPYAWRCYDATLRPFQEGRGAHEGESWHVRAYQAGCRNADDARRWWLETADSTEPYTVCLLRESLTKAKAITAISPAPGATAQVKELTND